MVDRQASECTVQHVPLRDLVGPRAWRASVKVIDQRDLADPAALADRHPARIYDDRIDPGVEAIDVCEGREIPPDGDPRLLDGVPGIGLGAERRERDPVSPFE